MTPPPYRNRQAGLWWLVLGSLAVGCAVAVVQLWSDDVAVVICLPLAVLFAWLAGSFAWLEIREEGEHLLARFGPLPLARRRIAYERVHAVKRDRSMLIEGWGVRLGPRGWIWNIWGREVVELELEKGRVRIGTDDPEGLVRLLEQRCSLS